MNAPIVNPADSEVRGVLPYFQAANVRPSEIHRRLVAVYGEYVMNAVSVRKWCTMFRNGRTDVHGDPLSSQTHWSKRWTASFERIDISQLAKYTMSGCVSYSCVRNCHRTFAIPQNLCTLGTADAEAAFWYEEGISKLVSRYDKCLIFPGGYVEK
jgi:hypothetical protein